MVAQLRRPGVDAPLEFVARAIEQHQDIFQMLALLGNAQGMDHRLLMDIALTQP